MTQITSQELAQVVCPSAQQGTVSSALAWGTEGLLLSAVFLFGIALGRTWKKNSD